MSKFYLVVGEAIFIIALCVVAFLMFRQHPPAAGAVHVDIKLPDSRAQVYLQHDSIGRNTFLVQHPGGSVEKLTADDLAQRLYVSASNAGGGGFLGANSTVVLVWLGIGFLGQLLFTGRMLVQWLASEKKGKSVVPPLFWWMSLIGSLLLLAYFLWRRDPIGLLGQAFGSFIYLRNILWILEGGKLSRVEVEGEASEPLTQPS
jgi:lipid-A-disaccharide synthase-like uncharacterized protein